MYLKVVEDLTSYIKYIRFDVSFCMIFERAYESLVLPMEHFIILFPDWDLRMTIYGMILFEHMPFTPRMIEDLNDWLDKMGYGHIINFPTWVSSNDGHIIWHQLTSAGFDRYTHTIICFDLE